MTQKPAAHGTAHKGPTVTLIPGPVVAVQPPTAGGGQQQKPSSPLLVPDHLVKPRSHLETTSGRIIIFSILIRSSPGNWK